MSCSNSEAVRGPTLMAVTTASGEGVAENDACPHLPIQQAGRQGTETAVIGLVAGR